MPRTFSIFVTEKKNSFAVKNIDINSLHCGVHELAKHRHVPFKNQFRVSAKGQSAYNPRDYFNLTLSHVLEITKALLFQVNVLQAY